MDMNAFQMVCAICTMLEIQSLTGLTFRLDPVFVCFFGGGSSLEYANA